MNSAIETQIGDSFPQLVKLIKRLLAPDGCPWDRKQTLQSLKPFLLEEAYEVLEAIDHENPKAHCEELGDLLFQIVFQAALQAQNHQFGIDDVCTQIVEKMVRRHPHIFGDTKVKNAEEVKVNWQTLKEEEQKKTGQVKRTLEGIPSQLPALLYAHQLGERAAAVGFDWPDVQGVREKLAEEMAELDEAIASGDRKAMTHELGDVLLTLTRLAGKLGISAEDALRTTNARFIRRFEGVEDLAKEEGLVLKKMKLVEFDRLWQQVKHKEKS